MMDKATFVIRRVATGGGGVGGGDGASAAQGTNERHGRRHRGEDSTGVSERMKTPDDTCLLEVVLSARGSALYVRVRRNDENYVYIKLRAYSTCKRTTSTRTSTTKVLLYSYKYDTYCSTVLVPSVQSFITRQPFIQTLHSYIYIVFALPPPLLIKHSAAPCVL